MFFLVERDYYKGEYCCLMDTPIYTVMLTYVFYFSRLFLLEGAVLIPKIGGGGIERTLQFHG